MSTHGLVLFRLELASGSAQVTGRQAYSFIGRRRVLDVAAVKMLRLNYRTDVGIYLPGSQETQGIFEAIGS